MEGFYMTFDEFIEKCEKEDLQYCEFIEDNQYSFLAKNEFRPRLLVLENIPKGYKYQTLSKEIINEYIFKRKVLKNFEIYSNI